MINYHVESVEKYRYSQREVADYLGLHYSTISRLLKKGGK
ncbi:MAG: helix-turn-helix domain-containing protein [Planctomycetes bacterium]|nr:helix-turn-helix domain-containing protein [Planctomycetota bacterium]